MKTLFAGMLLLVLAVGASASTIYVGNDTEAPVTTYTSAGVFIQNFGQNGATGTGIDAAGNVWTVAPNFGNNHIVEYNSSQTVLNSFTATINGQWIEDMSHGAGNTLWVGTFEGSVFAINDQTGAIQSTFTVANSSYTGVAFDGTNLWLSGGLSTNNLFRYSTTGTLLGTIALQDVCMGVGYDVSDNSLYCGALNVVRHYSITGTLLGSFTAQSFYHDGIEVANLGAQTGVPEPTSLLLIGTGLVGLVGVARRRRKNDIGSV